MNSQMNYKVCNCCGLVHMYPSGTARFHASGDDFQGYYWECECKSTLFWPAASCFSLSIDVEALNIKTARQLDMIDDLEFIRRMAAIKRAA